MDGRAAAQLVELSWQYRGKGTDEQDHEFEAALGRLAEENQGVEVGDEDYWLRVRDSLFRAAIQSHPSTEAATATIADQVVEWAISSGLDLMVYQIPLAILTAMISDDVIRAISKGPIEQTPDEAANFIIDHLSRNFRLDEDDKGRLRTFVRQGVERYQTESSIDKLPFEHYINELAEQLDDAYAAEYRGETISLGPLSAHIIATICPLWPFCT